MLEALPFVQIDEHGRVASLWDVAPSGDWSADNAAGADFAEALIQLMSAAEMPPILGHVMQAIGRAGAWTGIEVGFCHRIAVGAAAAG